MEESRKQFERYAAGRLRLPLEMIAAARGGDRYLHSHDSMSIMHPLNEWWAIWQASRATIEIELPKYHDYTNQDTTRAQAEKSAYNSGVYDSADAIRAAGIKVKE